MVSCVSCGISRTKKTIERGISFHMFPKNPLRQKQWIDFTKKMNLEPVSKFLLCSQHFNANCFDRSSLVCVRLKSDAIPTINVDRLKYLRTFNQEILSEPEQSVTASTEPFKPEASASKLELTHRELAMKRRIDELESRNVLKSKRIKKLQNTVWKQKRRIPRKTTITNVKQKRTKNVAPIENVQEAPSTSTGRSTETYDLPILSYDDQNLHEAPSTSTGRSTETYDLPILSYDDQVNAENISIEGPVKIELESSVETKIEWEGSNKITDDSGAMVDQVNIDFGKYVTKKLDGLSLEMAIYCRQVINEAIIEAEKGTLNASSKVLSDPLYEKIYIKTEAE